jgi:hypothetical protein
VPPIWHFLDSTVFILWPTQLVPHHQPLYPFLIYALEQWLGVSRAMVYALLVIQHALFIGSVVYLATAFQRPHQAFLISVAAVAGTWAGALFNTVATQGVELPLLILLCGFAFRVHFTGWRWRQLILFFLILLSLALARHASIIFGGLVPAYFVLMSIFSIFVVPPGERPAWRYLGYAAACCVTIGLAWFASSQVQRAACTAFGTNCTYSVTGRAGCYRILQTYQRMPEADRESWLATKVERLPVDQAFAFKAMAEGACWGTAYENVAKAYPKENPDRLMNAAFMHFLLSPDEYSNEQLIYQLRLGTYLINVPRLGILGGNLYEGAAPVPSPHAETRREKLGVTPADDAQLDAMRKTAWVELYDWYTFNALNGAAIILLLLTVIFGGPAAAALGLSLIIVAATYLLAVCSVTILVAKYIAPMNLLMYLLTAFCLCVLMDRVLAMRRAPESATAALPP